MSGVFQSIDPPPPHRPASGYPPPLVRGGGHTRWVERGVRGQYFGRRQTLLCTLHTLWVDWTLCLSLLIVVFASEIIVTRSKGYNTYTKVQFIINL